MSQREGLAHALRAARRYRRLPQEALDEVSSRTYISTLERGLKSPTLEKIDKIAGALSIHPLTLLAYSYLRDLDRLTQEQVLQQIGSELQQLAAFDQAI